MHVFKMGLIKKNPKDIFPDHRVNSLSQQPGLHFLLWTDITRVWLGFLLSLLFFTVAQFLALVTLSFT